MRASRRRATRRPGTSAVEAALVLPVFLLAVVGLIEMSQMGMASQILDTAAREGCRVAVINGRTPADVRAAVDARLQGARIAGVEMAVAPANWESAPKGTPITVTLSVPFRRISWLTEPAHLGGRSLRASATLGSERP